MEHKKWLEEAQTRLQPLLDEVQQNVRRFEDKAKPHMENTRQRLEAWQTRMEKNLDLNAQKARLSSLCEKCAPSDALIEKTSSWVEKQTNSLLDHMGIATRDDVDALKKRLGTLQRKVQELSKRKSN